MSVVGASAVTVVRIQGWDDVDLNLIPEQKPGQQMVIFYYDDGLYAEQIAQLKARWPRAILIPISVRPTDAVKGPRCFADDEPGDLTNDQLIEFYHAAKAAGVEIPGDYTSVSNVMNAINIMEGAGLVYGVDFLVWSAHYTGVPHLCGPQCGYGLDRTVHNTQYTDAAKGVNLDGDLCTALGVGMVIPNPDPNHYKRYDRTKRKLFGGKSEDEFVQDYDRKRAHIHSYEPGGGSLHADRDLCSIAASRIEHEISTDLVNGKEDQSLYWRGWRKAMLDRRAAGQKVTVN